ncbi:sodium:pantothenate symporter [Staphylococcus pseudintermedius]|nr:sodium:pantothenate symporter [Staphylococcus pseudintermedius]
MNDVKVYTWIGFIVFMALMITVGFVSSRKMKSISDFATGFGRIGPRTLGLSFAATYLSAATFLGYPGWSYTWGLNNLWLFLAMFIGGPTGVLMVAKRVRSLNTAQQSLSLPDWLGDFYDSSILRVGTAMILLFNIFYIASQLVAGALIFKYLLGMSYFSSLIVITVIVVLYVYVGGALADIYTDALQVIMMAVAGLTIFISGIVLFWKGSIHDTFSGIVQNLNHQNHYLVQVFNPDSVHFHSFTMIIGAIIIQWAFASAPHLFNKILGLKSEKDLGRMIRTYIFVMSICLLVLFGGIFSRVALGGQVESSDLALLQYIEWAFPAGIVALFGVVILAAAMSTTDGLFVSISTVFANDLFLKLIVKQKWVNLEEEKANRIAFRISRVSVPIVGLLSFLLVLKPPLYMSDFMWVGISGIAAGTMGPILHAVYAKRKAPGRPAELSMVVGLVSYLVIYFGGVIPSTMSAGAIATILGIFTITVMSSVMHHRASQLSVDKGEA